MSFEFLTFYIFTIFIASIIPGPSMLLALTHGIKYGIKRSLATAFGNTTASVLQAGISIAGLGAILTASESLFLIIKYAGVLYLVYIGINLWRAPALGVDLNKTGLNQNNKSLMKMYLQGFLVAVGNPKAIVFFTALFPQFINIENAHISQYCILVLTLGVIAFLCMMIYSIGGQKLMSAFSMAGLGKYFNRITGGVFISLGVGIAVSDR